MNPAESLVESFGAAAWLLGTSPFFSETRIRDVSAYISDALRIGQIVHSVGDDGIPNGLVIWAWAVESTIQRLANEGTWPPQMHLSEWREGRKLLVLNIVALRPNRLKDLLRGKYVRDFDAAEEVVWLDWSNADRRIRRRKMRSVKKKTSDVIHQT
jgi:hemolysin-activating ACP:hemolysin acyltransferase